MQSIRIGNDIPIEWRIYRLGDPEVLHQENVTVRLLDSFMKPVPFEYSVDENAIIGVFEGRNQKRHGAYTLKLVKNYGLPDMVTLDQVNAFTLVQHSFEEGGSTVETGLNINYVNLTSDIAVPSNGIDGDSAYKVACNNGFDGTEAEWLASLVGRDGKSAYELAQKNGFEGTEEEWLASLRGKDGENGLSAYELVRKNDPSYTATEAEFAAEQVKKVVTSDRIEAQTLDISNPDEDAVLYTAQTKTDAQKIQARQNINAADLDREIILEDADIEAMAADPTLLTSAVRVTPQVWTAAEQTQAQKNIGVADEARVVYLEEKMALLDKTGVTVIGDVTQLLTPHKDYVVDAINDCWTEGKTNEEHIGDLDTLEVKAADGTDLDNLVDALNVLKNSNGMSIVEEPVPDTDMVRTYSIYNGVDDTGADILVGKVNIPLDKVVMSAEIITAVGTEIIGQDSAGNSIRCTAGDLYAKVSFKNDSTILYVPLIALDYTAKQPNATAGETVLQVQVAVDQTSREISATIGEDTITHTELDKPTEAELDFTGYNHDYDDDSKAVYGTAQLTTTEQTLRGAVNELDALQGDKVNLPYLDESDPADPKYITITENLKKLYDAKADIIVMDALPAIDATISESDLYVLHETFDVTDATGARVQATNADGTLKYEADGVTPVYETEEYYTPYIVKDGAWVALYHRHEAETSAIDMDTEVTW